MVGALKLTNMYDMPNLLIRIICLTMHTESVKPEKGAVLEKKIVSKLCSMAKINVFFKLFSTYT